MSCGAGFYVNEDKSVCVACGRGKYSTNNMHHDNETSCLDCPAGRANSATGVGRLCSTCAKGKFGVEAAATSCEDCPKESFQPQDAVASTGCIACPTGYSQNLTGQSFCTSQGGVTPSDCSAEARRVHRSAVCAHDCVICGGASRLPARRFQLS